MVYRFCVRLCSEGMTRNGRCFLRKGSEDLYPFNSCPALLDEKNIIQ